MSIQLPDAGINQARVHRFVLIVGSIFYPDRRRPGILPPSRPENDFSAQLNDRNGGGSRGTAFGRWATFERPSLFDPERNYERPESGPSNGLRRERRYSLIELIATTDRKTAGALWAYHLASNPVAHG